MAVVVFDPAAFKARYPAFAGVSDAVLQGCFDDATLYLSNKDCSIVQDIEKRKQLLWMLTAHIAYLGGALNPAGSGGGALPVGRMSSATEGSVSISTEYAAPWSAAWFSQSSWGAAFWQATLSLRSFRYRPRPTCIT